MTPDNAIRFLAHQARLCRDRDSCEAFCLLLPAMMRIFGFEQMEEVEAAAFKYEFKGKLVQMPFQDAADRAAEARPAVKETLSPSAADWRSEPGQPVNGFSPCSR